MSEYLSLELINDDKYYDCAACAMESEIRKLKK